jgi:hypothetical protein
VFHEGSGKSFSTIPPNDFHFYELLNDVVQQEPATSLDPELMGPLAAIGIIKGKPFAPDARMKRILPDALAIATSRSLLMNPRDPEWYYYPGSAWMNFLFVFGSEFETPIPMVTREGVKPFPPTGYRQLDAPNANFLFVCPFAAPVLLMGLELTLNRPNSWPLKVARLLCAVPALFLFPLLIGYSVTTQDGKMDGVLILAALTIVLLALLAPQLEVLTARSKWLVPGTCALFTFSFILFGALRSGYDAEHPKPDTISYWLDTNTGKAS